MLSEFTLIARYFQSRQQADSRVVLGIGDDCALLAPTTGMQLAISSDMLVEGRHFFPGTDPTRLGHKSLAVNLSDLAAMGATPMGFTLSLALPKANETWLAGFSGGLLALAEQYQCPLIGGDTTKGPLTISITILGQTPAGQALRRDAAQVGDDIWITGTPGDARLGLAALQEEITLPPDMLAYAQQRLEAPTPRVQLGQALRGIAHAAIDLSDGLSGDLGHILTASGVGATIVADDLPVSSALGMQPQERQRQYGLAGGDDYELCITAPFPRRAAMIAAAAACHTPLTRIGTIEQQPGLRIVDQRGTLLDLALFSFDHFTS